MFDDSLTPKNTATKAFENEIAAEEILSAAVRDHHKKKQAFIGSLRTPFRRVAEKRFVADDVFDLLYDTLRSEPVIVREVAFELGDLRQRISGSLAKELIQIAGDEAPSEDLMSARSILAKQGFASAELTDERIRELVTYAPLLIDLHTAVSRERH
jgi:hypothetical protein